MKVIHLSFSASGGAGVAARRGVHALCLHGMEAELWTAVGDAGTRPLLAPWWRWFMVRLDSLPQRINRRKNLFSAWSNNVVPSRLAPRLNAARPDLVHLHWVGAGFLNLDELHAIRAPVVWTLHDTWPFTGGCHYPDDCDGAAIGCGRCPQLGSTSVNDASRRNYARRREALGKVASWVAPSAWMAGLANTRGRLPANRVRVVPNTVGEGWCAPDSRPAARDALGLSPDQWVLVAGAHDLAEPRKGCEFLPGAMERLTQQTGRRVLLVLFGEGRSDVGIRWPCEVRYTGYLHKQIDLAGVLQAADLLVLPSLQDNLPNIALEALACGCPVVGFDRGGLREIVDQGETGWLTGDATPAGLARAVFEWERAKPEPEVVARVAAERVTHDFSPHAHASRLEGVYATLLPQGRG